MSWRNVELREPSVVIEEIGEEHDSRAAHHGQDHYATPPDSPHSDDFHSASSIASDKSTEQQSVCEATPDEQAGSTEEGPQSSTVLSMAEREEV